MVPSISFVVTVSPSNFENSRFLRQLKEKFATHSPEIILVDDIGFFKSRNCFEAIPSGLNVRVLNTEGVGHLNASVIGFGQCQGDIIVTIDPDMYGNISDITKFIKMAEAGASLVYGVRVVRGDVPKVRHLLSKLYNRILQSFFLSVVRDINVPMILMKRELVKEVMAYKGEHGSLKLFMPFDLGCKFSEVEIQVVCEDKGPSAYSFPSLFVLFFLQLKEVFRYRAYVRSNRR